MFQQVKQSRVFQDVVDQIQEAILQGKIMPGSRLPAERELTDIFKASRGTLREALRVLEQKGLISIKTGVKGGAVVNQPTTHPVSESLDLLIRYQRVSLRDLAEFREGVEGMVAAMAAKRGTQEDLRKLKGLLKEAGICLKQGTAGWEAFIRIDNQIHMSLAKMAGNPVYESVLRTVYDNIHRYFDRFLPREEGVILENYKDLREIVKAVEEGRAEKASLLVQDHVSRFNRRMEENEKGAGKIQKY
ncbi:MAG: FadR/GntR family transcriptional regulator [Desulfatiglandales bacterium]